MELDRPNRVVFTWGWETEALSPRPGESTVEVTFEAVAAGTLVRLVHRDLPGEQPRAAHRHGWEHYGERLSVAAGGGDPGPDPWATPEGSDRDFDRNR